MLSPLCHREPLSSQAFLIPWKFSKIPLNAFDAEFVGNSGDVACSSSIMNALRQWHGAAPEVSETPVRPSASSVKADDALACDMIINSTANQLPNTGSGRLEPTLDYIAICPDPQGVSILNTIRIPA